MRRTLTQIAGITAPRRYREGGHVRGPGTSTSDSIPARLSDGEFVLPTDTVRKVGVRRLQDLVQMTHKPSGQPAHPGHFAEGGVVDSTDIWAQRMEQERGSRRQQVNAVAGEAMAQSQAESDKLAARSSQPAAATGGLQGVMDRRSTLGNTAPGAAALAPQSQGSSVAQIPTDGYRPAPKPDGSQESWRNTEVGRNLTNAAAALPGVAGALPTVAKTGGAISSGLNAASRLMNIGAATLGATAIPMEASATPVPTGQRPLPGGVPPSMAGAGRGSVNPPMKPQPAISYSPPSRPAGQPLVPFNFEKFQPQSGEGAFRNEQTGEVTRLQDGPSGTQVWKPQQPSPAQQSPAGFTPATPRQDVRAPVLNPNGGVFAAMTDFANQKGDAVNAIAANKGARNDRKDDLDQTRVGADIAATGARLSLDGQRVGLDAQRVAQGIAQGNEANRIAGEELSMRREAAGFQTRAAKRLEDLQSAYQDQTKTDAERLSIARQLRELQGKEASPSYKSHVLPNIKNADGTTTMGGVYQENLRTGGGQWVQPQGQGAAPAVPSSRGAMVKGQVYQTARGPARWDGGQFQLVR